MPFAGCDEAQTNTIKEAKALAMTALDVYCNPGILDDIKAQFIKDTTAQ